MQFHSSLEAALSEAHRLHQQGEREAALRAYQQITDYFAEEVASLHVCGEQCAQAYLGLGQVQWESGAQETALISYQRARALGQTNDTSLTHAAQWFFAQQDYAEVQRQLCKVSEHTEEQRVLLARAYLRSGRLEDALHELVTAVALQPESVAARYYLACAWGHLGEFANAIEEFQRVLRLAPQNALAYLQRGHARLQMQQLDEAKQDYEKAEQLGLGAPLAAAYECLGLLYGKQENDAESYQFLSRAAQFGAASDTLYFQLGLSCYHLRKWPEAIQSWDILRTRHPQNLTLAVSLNWMIVEFAAAQVAEQRWSEAISTLLQCNERDASLLPPELAAEKEKLLACAFLGAGRLAELLLLDSQQQDVLYYQACGLYRASRYDEAVRKLRQVLATQPEAENTRRLLADSLSKLTSYYARQGQWEKASAVLREVFAQDAERRERLTWDPRLITGVAGVYALGQEQEEAMEIWEEWQFSEISDSTAAHALLVLSLCDTIRRGESGRLDRTDATWQRIIRNAVLLLHARHFWGSWKTQVESRYGVAISAQAIAEIKSKFEQKLLELLPPTLSLGAALRNELAAARALEQMGGFLLPAEEERALVCGLGMLRHLGYTRSFGQFVRRCLETQPDAPELRRLQRHFSRLGLAQALLDHGWPKEALQSLQQSCCASCAARVKSTVVPIRVCQADCRDFAEGNPAYAELKNKGYRLWQDAARLAAEAHLALADAQITVSPLVLAQIVQHWQEALRLAQMGEVEAEFQTILMQRVLGQVRKLKQQRLDDAVSFLEAALRLSRESLSGELGGRLSELLNERGLQWANRTPPDWEAASRDLRRAVELNPHLPKWRRNLVIALRQRAAELVAQPSDASPTRLRLAAQSLLEAHQVIASEEFSDQEDLQTEATKLKDEMAAVASWLNKSGIEKAERTRFEEGLEDLWLAHRLAPQVAQIGDNLCEATANYVYDLVAQGRKRLAREKLEAARREFPENASLRRAQKHLSSGR